MGTTQMAPHSLFHLTTKSQLMITPVLEGFDERFVGILIH